MHSPRSNQPEYTAAGRSVPITGRAAAGVITHRTRMAEGTPVGGSCFPLYIDRCPSRVAHLQRTESTRPLVASETPELDEKHSPHAWPLSGTCEIGIDRRIRAGLEGR